MFNLFIEFRSNEELVRHVKENVSFSDRIEEAMLKVPREDFVTDDLKPNVYTDTPLRFRSFGFNTSAPHMYGVCLQELDIQPGDHVLDVGSGCGHFTTISSFLTGPTGIIHGIELRNDIVEFSKSNLQKFREKYNFQGEIFQNIDFFVHNVFLPRLEETTYDRIHVGASCPKDDLKKLISLLNVGGILITPSEDSLLKITKNNDGEVSIKELLSVRYGDLVLPTEAEISIAKKEIEKEKARRIVIPKKTILNPLLEDFNKKEDSDVMLKVEGKEIFAHKETLAERSEHFKTMFFGGLRESRESVVTFADMKYGPFVDTIRYIYTGDIDLVSADHAVDILELANYFKLDHLKALCEEVIAKTIDADNAGYLIQIALRHNASQLKTFGIQFLMDHFEETCDSQVFQDLDKNTHVEIVREVCKRARLLD